MTAEVAIINANAVAIAADSAVTIGSGKKIYNSALKVFALSKIAPVGIMVYGNAGLLGVPWETLIKIYRSGLGLDKFKTLEEYADDFFKFLANSTSYFPKEVQESWIRNNIAGYYELIRNQLFKMVEKKFKEKGSIDDSEAIQIFLECVKDHHANLEIRQFAKGFGKSTEATLRKNYTELSKTIVEEIFQGIKTSKEIISKLYDISAMLHSREIFSDSRSGVVFAGFGDEEIYPAVCTFEIEGIIGKKLKYKHLINKSMKVNRSYDCSIIPFAQDDMVASFMEGVNPAVAHFINQYLHQLIGRFPDLLEDADIDGDNNKKVKVRKELKKKVERIITDFFQQLSEHKKSEHISPILNMVHVLPKDELAAMAESLVNLTAFKRRMTEQLETVGGPIDVAVISKGDGLVWVKRKHYFPAELNQHFFANYYREIKCETEKTGE